MIKLDLNYLDLFLCFLFTAGNLCCKSNAPFWHVSKDQTCCALCLSCKVTIPPYLWSEIIYRHISTCVVCLMSVCGNNNKLCVSHLSSALFTQGIEFTGTSNIWLSTPVLDSSLQSRIKGNQYHLKGEDILGINWGALESVHPITNQI